MTDHCTNLPEIKSVPVNARFLVLIHVMRCVGKEQLSTSDSCRPFALDTIVISLVEDLEWMVSINSVASNLGQQ